MAFYEGGALNSNQISTLFADCEKIGYHAKLDLNCTQLYAKRCRRMTEDLLALMKIVGWLSSKEALDCGFLNEITDLEEESATRLINALTSIKASFVIIVTIPAHHILGHSLTIGDWCIVTSLKRHQKIRNFASLISARLAQLLGIPFYEDIAECHSKHRVFTFGKEPPTESNIIVFDDFVTTGATMISMNKLLEPLGKNLVFFIVINNKSDLLKILTMCWFPPNT